MHEFLINFIGIVTFMTTPIGGVQDARHVVIPRFEQTATVIPIGQPAQTVEAHVPYIAFTTDACGNSDCVDYSNWPGQQPDKEFRRGTVKWAFVRVSGFHLSVKDSQNPLLIAPSFNTLLPKLTDYCPGLTLPAEFADDQKAHARKAATIDVATGKLSARGNISLDKGVVTDWTVTVPGDLVIEATPYGGGPTRSLKLKAGTTPAAVRIEIGNAPQEYIENPDNPHHPTTTNHFLVYYTANQASSDADVPFVTPCSRRPRPHGSAAPVPGLMASNDRLPSADCSNSNYP